MTKKAVTAAPEQEEYFSVAIPKFILMSIATIGLYQIYWFWKNWKVVESRESSKKYPLIRAVFAPIFAYSLFQRIKVANPVVLALGYFVIGALWRLPDSWGVLSVFSFVPLIPVQQMINAKAKHGVSEEYTAREKAAILAGLFLYCLLAAALLFPATA